MSQRGAWFVCLCVCREHSYVQLCAELSGSVPCPAPQAATAPPDGIQVGRQEFLDLSSLLGCQRRLSAPSAAQSGPCGDLWRGDCRHVSGLPPGQAGMDWYSAAGAGQVRWDEMRWASRHALNCFKTYWTSWVSCGKHAEFPLGLNFGSLVNDLVRGRRTGRRELLFTLFFCWQTWCRNNPNVCWHC